MRILNGREKKRLADRFHAKAKRLKRQAAMLEARSRQLYEASPPWWSDILSCVLIGIFIAGGAAWLLMDSLSCSLSEVKHGWLSLIVFMTSLSLACVAMLNFYKELSADRNPAKRRPPFEHNARRIGFLLISVAMLAAMSVSSGIVTAAPDFVTLNGHDACDGKRPQSFQRYIGLGD